MVNRSYNSYMSNDERNTHLFPRRKGVIHHIDGKNDLVERPVSHRPLRNLHLNVQYWRRTDAREEGSRSRILQRRVHTIIVIVFFRFALIIHMQQRGETITKSPVVMKLTSNTAISANAFAPCDSSSRWSLFVLSSSVNSAYRFRPSHGTERKNAGDFIRQVKRRGGYLQRE